jgi:flagellar hook-associated protein 1 FlgK
MVGRLDQARRDADSGVRDGVGQVIALAQRIASLNASLGAAAGGAPGGEVLKDSLNEALKSLSGLIDIGTIQRADGGVDVSFGNGRPLVIGANTYTIDVASTPPSGSAALLSDARPSERVYVRFIADSSRLATS